ncbi:MAG: hypothetical protein DI616_06120 [Paracoccus denitrificans]|uniref:Cytochrome c domain-containing protein n=1 Tax=Paracoccus denitrificans TaxID=266 RepID=A0A533I8S9_PARDE|nr:MAG: hypothetical protein DI616_06120 [Paracoccus denitrificans]
MRRYLLPVLSLVVVLLIGFAVGFHSGFKKDILFEGIVKAVRLMQPPNDVNSDPALQLDMTDQTLLDSTILPTHKREVLIADPSGRPVPLLASAVDTGDESIVIGAQGSLFRLKAGACPGDDCVSQIGRLVRPDGTLLDDIYDMISVEVDGKREWYVSYGQKNRTRYEKWMTVSRFDLPEGEGDIQRIEEPLFKAKPFSLRKGHSVLSGGGSMAYDQKTDDIILTIGDFSLNGVSNDFPGDIPPPQTLESDLGKIFRINRTTGERHVVSIGHRNPQGLALSAEGELISTEHGPKGGDEINLIEDGNNYGWPYTSFGTVYTKYTFPEHPPIQEGRFGEFTLPILSFLPSPGISALTFIEDFDPAWDGDLMVTTLKARTLFRVRRWQTGDQTGSYVEQIYIGDRMRDIDIVDGVMILTTDSGKIIMLTPVEDIDNVRTETGLVANLNVLASCGSCHNMNYPVSTQDAPHLRNIVGRNIASASDFSRYSDALKEMSNQTWDPDSLERFLRAPQDFAPGTAMPDMNLSDDDMTELMADLALLR